MRRAVARWCHHHYHCSRAARSAADALRCISSRADEGIRHVSEVEGVPPPGAFSRAVVAGGLVYVSGTGASNDTGQAPGLIGNISEETTLALENVERILLAAGATKNDIVQVTMLLTDRNDYADCNAAYISFFKGRPLPARSTGLWGVPTTAKVAFSCIALARGAPPPDFVT